MMMTISIYDYGDNFIQIQYDGGGGGDACQ